MRKKVFLQAINDFFSKEVLYVSLVSFILTVFAVFGLFYLLSFLGSEISTQLLLYVQGADGEQLFATLKGQLSEYAILEFLFGINFFAYLLDFIIFLNLLLLFYLSFLMLYSIIIGFIAPVLIKRIQKRYYPEVELKGIKLLPSLWFYLKTITVTLLLLFIFLPLFFIPAINFLALLPLYYFFHKALVFDVSSVLNDYEEYRKLSKVNWFNLKFQTFVCFLLSLVPVIGIVIYPFYIITLSHTLFGETKQLRQHRAFSRK